MNTNIIKPLSTCPRTPWTDYTLVHSWLNRLETTTAQWRKWDEDRPGYWAEAEDYGEYRGDDAYVGWIDLNGELKPDTVADETCECWKCRHEMPKIDKTAADLQPGMICITPSYPDYSYRGPGYELVHEIETVTKPTILSKLGEWLGRLGGSR